MHPVTTERLRLREFSFEDAAFVLRLLNEPSFIANIADRGVRSIADAERYLAEGPMTSYARNGFGLWLVELVDSGEPAGMCGLIRREGLEDADIGYAFLPRYRGRGYAFEAAQGVVAHARALGIARLAAITTPGNAASIALLLRLGMRFEGTRTLAEGAPPLNLYRMALSER